MQPKKSIIPVKSSQDANIIVGCRFRPLNEKEKERGGMDLNVEFLPDNKTVILNQQFEGFGSQRFTYDYVFPPSSEQLQVYESTALPIVDGVMQGFNGTVFAYGQTSSGKTFTMAGADIYDESLKGIIPRMVSTVFDRISKAEETVEFLVRIGFCEIYLEKIKDLIDPTRKDLKVQEDKARGVYIAGLSEHYVNSGDELMKFMDLGQSNREVGFTLMNAGSSRSHSIFIATINQKSLTDYSEKTGKLFLVDLAGSEKVSKTGAKGKLLEEAKNINKSLTCLGKVINSLTDGSTHIPYRDSKLTRVLQDSLGGNSKTALIITCSPSPYNESETMSTLRFGIRAKAIKNKPKVNKEFTVAELKVLLSRAEEQILKKDIYIKELEDLLSKAGILIPSSEDSDRKNEEEQNEMFKELKEAKDSLNIEYEKNEGLQSELINAKTLNESLEEDLKSLKGLINNLENSLNDKNEEIENKNELNRALKDEINNYNQEKIELETRINNLEFDLEKYKNLSQEKKVDNDSVKTFDNYLESYNKFEKEFFQAEDFLKSKLSSEEDITGLRDIFIKHLIHEKAKISQTAFKEFLEDYYKELEKASNNSKIYEKKYTETLDLLSLDKKDIIITIQKLNFQIETLTNLYSKLLNEKANFKVEQQLSRNKVKRLQEAYTEQDNEIKSLKENLENISSEFSAKALEMVENSKIEESSSFRYSNIRKPIKGGKSFFTRASEHNLRNAKMISSLLTNISTS